MTQSNQIVEAAAAMTIREDTIRQHPDFPWLSLDDPGCLDSFLHQRGWLAADEQISRCEKPGEGNMNLTMRAITDQRTLIVKQARPWVEKYDHIAAPWDRVEYEHRFYERIQSIPDVADRMPKLLHADMPTRILVLEDLGDAQPLTSLYGGEDFSDGDLQQLANYLRTLHDATRGATDSGFQNLEMRQLNHQHIFAIPLAEDSGIDLEQLEPGLLAAAACLRNDSIYQDLVESTGNRYLSTGPVLLHGDFFPGSWLRTAAGIFVIDPEFCFYGDPEFDLGCTIAHLCLAGQPREQAQAFLQAYTERGQDVTLDLPLLASFAAVEVMRRLIGVAQLPLQSKNGQRAELLEQSRDAMVNQSWEKLWN